MRGAGIGWVAFALAWAGSCGGSLRAGLPDVGPVHLLVVGPLQGRLEPCGCTGGMLGGIPRMKTLVDLEATSSTILVDTGDVAGADGEYGRLKAEILALAVGDRGRGAAARLLVLGEGDAGFPAELWAPVQGIKDYELVDPGAGRAVATPDGVIVRVQSILPGEAMEAPGMPDALVVLLVHGDRAEAEAALEAAPQADLALVLHGGEQPDEAVVPHGDAATFAPGKRGRHLVSMVISRRDGRTVVADLRVLAVDESVPPDPGMEALFLDYRRELVARNIVASRAALEDHPDGAYAGSASCQECHADAYRTLKQSRHGHAMEVLEKDQAWADPECISCHTVGYGFVSGYEGRSSPPDLAGVGCEACHGPSGSHAAEPSEYRTPGTATDCIRCHDAENSPAFWFDDYWPGIEH